MVGLSGTADQFTHQHVLRVVGVLVLVDEHVTEAAAVVLGNLGKRLEKRNGLTDEIDLADEFLDDARTAQTGRHQKGAFEAEILGLHTDDVVSAHTHQGAREGVELLDRSSSSYLPTWSESAGSQQMTRSLSPNCPPSPAWSFTA